MYYLDELLAKSKHFVLSDLKFYLLQYYIKYFIIYRRKNILITIYVSKDNPKYLIFIIFFFFVFRSNPSFQALVVTEKIKKEKEIKIKYVKCERIINKRLRPNCILWCIQ